MPDRFPGLVDVTTFCFDTLAYGDLRKAVLVVINIVILGIDNKMTRVVNESKLPVIASSLHPLTLPDTDLSQTLAKTSCDAKLRRDDYLSIAVDITSAKRLRRL